MSSPEKTPRAAYPAGEKGNCFGRGKGLRSRNGYTLIELMIVVLMLGLLAGIAIPMVLNAVQRAREAAVVAYMEAWPSAIEMFRQDFQRLPVSIAKVEQNGYLSGAGSLPSQYIFILAGKVAGAPAASDQVLAKGQQQSWWTAVTQWSFVRSAWADKDDDEDDEDGDGGGDADNAGGGAEGGGGAGGTAYGGWEGWANPVSGVGKHFYIDDTGVTRYSIDAPASTNSPVF